MEHANITFNENVFAKNIDYNIECEAKNVDNTSFLTCCSLKRIIEALTYYDQLNVEENTKHCGLFNVFISMYSQLIDDYIHIHNYHSNQLERINRQLTVCDFSSCKYTSRHHEKSPLANELDSTILFYTQTMDSIHFYLHHCFHVGLRVKAHEIILQKQYDNEEKKNHQYFDRTFSTMNTIILQTEGNTKNFNRFTRRQNNKFNLNTRWETVENVADTYLDDLYQYLKNNNVLDSNIIILKLFMQTEEYDTDCFEYDICLNYSNITKSMDNDIFIGKIKQYVEIINTSASSFSVGLRFYYWNYYKQLEQLEDDEQQPHPFVNNYNDHGGYNVCDLFIEPRYDSFKQEICFYKHFTLKQYQQSVIIKVNKYKNANIVKKTKAIGCDWPYCAPYVNHYNIKKDQPLTFSHLLSLILYCDCTDLCSDFSATFRKNKSFETLENVKKRNSQYYYLSKYLREVVEAYGQCSVGDGWDSVNEKYTNALSGPFYSGMNKVMSIPEFNIRLCSPTSTSIHIEVAVKFSGKNGIILQFDNTSKESRQYDFLRAFNVSWLSRYKEEDERLFFGGFYFIKLQSVRIRRTQQNFETFIHSLYYLDTMLTGGKQKDLNMSTDDILVIKTLFSRTLEQSTTLIFDDYIYSTFAVFIDSKTQMVLDLHQLQHANKELRGLLMQNWNQRVHEENINRNPKDVKNLFRSELFLIFKNIKCIIIKTTSNNGDWCYSLSFISLLSLIELVSLNKVIVQANTYYYNKYNLNEKYNWIDSEWNLHKRTITEQYTAKQYTIISKTNKYGTKCWLEINKQT